MNEQFDLFEHETDILVNAKKLVAQYQQQSCDVPLAVYQKIVIDYEKLLRQTKTLVRMSDKQQYQLNDKMATITRINEQKLAQFLEAVPVGIFVIDKQAQPYYANQRAQQILKQQINPSLLNTTSLPATYQAYIQGSQQIYPDEKQPIIRALLGESSKIDDMEIHHQEGITPIEIWGTPIFDEKGEVAYAIAAFHDISERRQAERDKIQFIQTQEAKQAALRYTQEIEAKNAKLIQLNQEKNEFLGIVAHDLKNPLSGILGLTEIIQDSIDSISKDELFEYCKMVQESTDMMFQLVINLLDVNLIESGNTNIHLKETDVLTILNTLIKNYYERAQAKNLTLLLETDNTSCIAFVDQNVTYQILDNLISNAIKYSPLDKNIYITLCRQNEVIRCQIRDEGIGLSQTDQQKLFGKFTRLTAKPTGGEHSTGLGLFIVKKLVDMIHGKVWCESELGQGATFIVELPAA